MKYLKVIMKVLLNPVVCQRPDTDRETNMLTVL